MAPWSSLFLINNTNKNNRKIPFIILPEVLPPMIFHRPELRLWDSLVLRFPSRLLHAGMDASDLTCVFLPSSLLIELIRTELLPCVIRCAGCYLSTCHVPFTVLGTGAKMWLLTDMAAALPELIATLGHGGKEITARKDSEYRCARINTGYARDI